MLVICFLFFWGCNECSKPFFGAGSYPYAETWIINASEGEVVAAIIELKKENPSLQPPGEEEFISVRDTASHSDYWRHANFYYVDTKEVAHAWTRPHDSTLTSFALVSISDKVVNQDFWYLKNKLEIRKFEKQVVDKIKDKIAERK